MQADKSRIVKDLRFCKELMDRLLNQAERLDGCRGYCVLQSDVIRLRRELLNVKHELSWEWSEND